MSRRRLMNYLAVLLATCCAAQKPAPVWGLGGGDVGAGRISLGGRGAYYDPGDGDGVWYGGAQLRWHMTDVLALEGSVDYREEDLGKNDTLFDLDARVLPIQASLLVYLLPQSRVTPFLLGGGGWYSTKVEISGLGDETQDRFGAHAGGGLQFFLDRSWSIDATYRYVWLEGIKSKGRSLTETRFKQDGPMATAGINFHF